MSWLPGALPGSPTFTPGAALGTGATIALAAGSTNTEGRIAVTPGTGGGHLASGQVLGLTFGGGLKFANGCIVVFSPGDANFSTIAGNLYATDRVDGIDLYARNALNMANTAFTGYYRISGR